MNLFWNFARAPIRKWCALRENLEVGYPINNTYHNILLITNLYISASVVNYLYKLLRSTIGMVVIIVFNGVLVRHTAINCSISILLCISSQCIHMAEHIKINVLRAYIFSEKIYSARQETVEIIVEKQKSSSGNLWHISLFQMLNDSLAI